jgi:hypothetical protein
MQVEIVRKVKLEISAEEWQAYSSMPKCDKAAKRVTNNLEAFINRGLTRDEVFRNMQIIFQLYSKFGFYDGDSNYTLDVVLNKVFGKQ